MNEPRLADALFEATQLDGLDLNDEAVDARTGPNARAWTGSASSRPIARPRSSARWTTRAPWGERYQLRGVPELGGGRQLPHVQRVHGVGRRHAGHGRPAGAEGARGAGATAALTSGRWRAAVAAAAARRDSQDNSAMIQQRTLKSLTRAVGVGVHSGHKVELTLRPAPPDTGIVFRRTDLPVPVDIPVNAHGGQRHAHGQHHQPRRRPRRAQGADHRTPDVGLRRPRPGQPLRRHHRRGGAHPRRQRGQLRLPAAKRRHRAAGRAQAFPAREEDRWRCAKARARR